MKFKTVIDKDREEQVIICAHERSKYVELIESFVDSVDSQLYGYTDTEVVRIEPGRVECFYSQGGRVYARMDGKELMVRERLYTIEESMGSLLVKINQSALVSVDKIARFEITLGGALVVVLHDGWRDYVSRRQVKYVKERLGLK